MADNEQFGFSNRLDRLRLELEGKINKVEDKVEKKLDAHIFWTLFTVIFIAIGAAWVYVLYFQNVKMDDFQRRISTLEGRRK